MATTLPKCLVPFAPGPILRITILFGPGRRALRCALRDQCDWIGEHTGRWVQLNTIGDPSVRDDFADRDRELRGVSLDEWRRDWKESRRDHGTSRRAEDKLDFQAAKELGLPRSELPCMLIYFPGEERFSRKLSLKEWLGQFKNARLAVDSLGDVLSSDQLLEYIRHTRWSVIGVDQLHELTDWIGESLAASDGANPRLTKAQREAWNQYKSAVAADPTLATDKQVFDWLGGQESVGKTFETWSKHLTNARKVTGTQKRPRRARGPSRSVIPARERDRPRDQ